MENQERVVQEDKKMIKLIEEQKQKIVGMMKIQGLNKTGADQFLNMIEAMLTGVAGKEMGITAEMKEKLAKDWPTIKEQILKEYEA